MYFKVLGLFISIFFFTQIYSVVFAEVSITPTTISITDQEEINLDLTLKVSGQKNKNYYLEAAIKKDDGTNYFGQTFNDNEWIKYTNSNFLNLKKVTTDDNAEWTGELKVKLDTTSSYYKGSGTYNLFIKRFTEGGSGSLEENKVILNITATTPSETISPSNSPTANPTPTKTPKPTSQFLISSLTTTLNSNESLGITTELQNFTPNTNFYLKGAIYQSGSTNYFGETEANGWIKNNATYSSQLKITTDDKGYWKGIILVKSDPNDSGYKGPGKYEVKIGRYSETGSGPSWSNTLTINLQGSISSPSPRIQPTSNKSSAILGSSKVATESSIASLPKINYPIASFSTTPKPLIKNEGPKVNWWLMLGGSITLIIGIITLVIAIKKR